jgi:hypothetical protein
MHKAMKPRQAFKIVSQYFWKAMQDLNWDANLYDRGEIKNPRTKKASKQRNKAHEAIGILYQLAEEKEKTN